MVLQKAGKLRKQHRHQQRSNKESSHREPGRSLKLSKHPAGAVSAQYKNVDSDIERLQNRRSSYREAHGHDGARHLLIPTQQMPRGELVSQNSPAKKGLSHLARHESRHQNREPG